LLFLPYKMVRITSFIGAVALLSSVASAAPSFPRPRSNHESTYGYGEAAKVESSASAAYASTTAASYETSVAAHETVVVAHVTTSSAAHETTSVAAQHQTTSVAHTTSSAAHQVTSAAQHTTSSMAHETTSIAAQKEHTTSVVVQATTSAAHTTAALPTHGSGSSNWGSPAYDDCVQQCIATYGKAPVEYKATPTAAETAGSTGTGATHIVIVAPTQGVLRYIPFAVNATVGDTIKFMWGANNHTVTKSSALLPCNKTGDAVFASGTQNKDFVFTQVVNSTDPTYFFCGTVGHCQKGMFGIVNPTTNFAAATSVSGMMQSIAANSSVVETYAAYTRKQTEGNKVAANWGGNIDLNAFPDWSHEFVAENVLFTRNFLAANPETIKEDGSIDLASADSTPLSIPQDITAALATSGDSASTVSPAATSAAAPEATPNAGTANAGSLNNSNSASSASAPRLLVAVMAAIGASVLLL
jgi:hypothetical protein